MLPEILHTCHSISLPLKLLPFRLDPSDLLLLLLLLILHSLLISLPPSSTCCSSFTLYVLHTFSFFNPLVPLIVFSHPSPFIQSTCLFLLFHRFSIALLLYSLNSSFCILSLSLSSVPRGFSLLSPSSIPLYGLICLFPPSLSDIIPPYCVQCSVAYFSLCDLSHNDCSLPTPVSTPYTSLLFLFHLQHHHPVVFIHVRP